MPDTLCQNLMVDPVIRIRELEQGNCIKEVMENQYLLTPYAFSIINDF